MLQNVMVGTYILVRTVGNDVEPSGLFWLKVVRKTKEHVFLAMGDNEPIKFALDGECLEPGPDIGEIIEVKEVM
jgi:hypothetical protein